MGQREGTWRLENGPMGKKLEDLSMGPVRRNMEIGEWTNGKKLKDLSMGQ